ncbi:MAG: ankyrin repeat domain-containing protein [Acetobacteraceae bacterium]|nr:ankyrin repeat domain-containing protein [Acetobacteraceae bacterium]
MRNPHPLIAAFLAAVLALGHAAAQQRGQPRQAPVSPTQALFDAINLGDIDEVRAAVAAGADLGARNVLGLTPLDLALDLGQSEIAFFLMSLGRVPSRGTVPQREQPRPAAAVPPAVQRGEATRSMPPAASGVSAPPASAPLWRGDGGSPVPEAGFLGFDAGRPEGARQPQPQRPRG